MKKRALRAKVLIVPLWNWNQYAGTSYAPVNGFNCTFMELKLSKFLKANDSDKF